MTLELRDEIFLSSHQVFFLILQGNERPPREILGHSNGGGEGILPIIYIALKNPISTHHRSKLLIGNMCFVGVDESHI